MEDPRRTEPGHTFHALAQLDSWQHVPHQPRRRDPVRLCEEEEAEPESSWSSTPAAAADECSVQKSRLQRTHGGGEKNFREHMEVERKKFRDEGERQRHGSSRTTPHPGVH